MKNYKQIIFLSTTNTFLSPIAEAIYRRNASEKMPKAISRGLVVLFEEPINPKCNLLLTKNSFPISAHGQARQLVKEDLEEDSLVITMTLSEKVKVAEDFGVIGDVYTLGEFVGFDTDITLSPGVGEEEYQKCFEELLMRVNKLIQRLKDEKNAST